MKPLILIGGGGHCKSVIEVAESTGNIIKGILDIPSEIGKKVLNYEIIGCDNDIPQYINEVEFIITVGFIKDPTLRIKLFRKVLLAGGKLATLIASTAYVSAYSKIGQGSVIMHNAFVNADVNIGENVIINSFTNIEHDSIIGNQTHISTGVMINGGCNVGNNVFIGSQSVVANEVNICDDAIIGAGSFVRKSIVQKGIYSGNPVIFKIKL